MHFSVRLVCRRTFCVSKEENKMGKIFKRTLATIMVVLIVLTSAPLGGFIGFDWKAFAIDDSQELILDTDNQITRAEWLHNLAVVFEMTVEDEIYPDNYFSDLEDTHEYYYDVLLNVNFGVVDVEAGGEVNPDGLVTRSFASHTLNFCLGYQLEDDTTYTFTDTTVCEYPADAQVAVNRGWLELVDGKFCPENSITDKEVRAMLDDTKVVLGDSEIDVDYDSEFTFSSEVIEVEDGTEIEVSDNSIIIHDSPVEITTDDIFAVYKSGIPLVYKAKTVSVQENATIITATYIDDTNGNYILEADAQGEADLEDVVITPAEGVDINLNYEEEQVSLFALGKGDGKKKLANISAKGSIKLGSLGYSVSYSVEMKDPTIKYAYNIGKRTAQVSFECDVESKTTLKVDLLESHEKEVLIFNLGVPGVGGLDVYLKFDLSGSVSAVTKSSCKVGASYSPKDNFRSIKNFSSSTFSFQAKISGSAGVIVKLGVTQLPLVKAYVYAEAGGKASVDLKAYSSGTPKSCVEFAAYVYANYGATFKLKAGIFSFEAKAEEKVWDSKSSPARIAKHYEDNKPVVKCTRGDSGSAGSGGSGGSSGKNNYYTKSDSAYSGGWSEGDNSYGFNKYGEKVQLFEYSLDGEGNATITSYKGNATVVNIPETIDGHKVVAIAKKVFSSKKFIRSVDISDSVTNIGDEAFVNCYNLSEVKLSESLARLGERVFSNSSITEVTLPKTLEDCESGYTNLDYTGYDGPFSDCENLKTVIFEEGTTKIAPRVLAGCKSVTTVSIPETVTSIGSKAFGMCENISKIKMPDTVTSIGFAAFYGCSSLTDINISKSLTWLGERVFSNSGITEATLPKTLEECESGYENLDYTGYDGPFSDCANLKTVIFEEGTTKIAPRVLAGCKSVTTVSIPESVTSIGSKAFGMCENISKIKMPDTVTSIGFAAFYGCSSLTDINISKSLTWLGERVFSNSGITEATLPKTLEECESGYENLDYTGYDGPFSDCANLKTVIFEEGTTKIAPRVLAGCKSVTTVSIPETVTSIGSKAFGMCTNLTSIQFSETLDTIEFAAFYGDLSLENIVLPDSVTGMGTSVFASCTSLKTVVLPNTRKNIMEKTFDGCVSLEKIVFPSTVTTVQAGAFRNCSSLKEVIMNDGLLTIEKNAFENCDGLTSIYVPNSVTSMGSSVFYDCDALTEVTLSNNLTSFGTSLFYDCDTLTNVTLGTGLTSLPASTFEHCDALETVDLPYRTASIGNNAFKDCVKFTSVTIPRATTSIASNAFSYPAKLTIKGVAGTYAETYANEIGAKFVDKQVNATAVTIDKKTATLNKGQSMKLVMTVTPSNFTDEVSWKSGNTDVATISADGTITAKSVGTATIKLTVGNVSASCKVTVVQPVTSVNIDKSSVTMQAHDTYQLKLTVYPDNAANKTVEWSSSASDIASVDQNGLVTAHKKGEATIRVDAKDGSNKYDTCKIIVSNNGVIANSVSELESAHNYPVNCTDFWKYTSEGAANLEVTFDERTNIEDGFDYIYIYDKNGAKIGTYTGTELAGKTIFINGDTVRIQLDSDDSGTEWGFKVTDIKIASSHKHSYISKITKAATCTATGVSTFACSCGDTYTETIAKLGHKLTTLKAVTATCTKTGLTEGKKCSICGTVTVAQKTVAKKPHTYKNITTKATLTKNGKVENKCSVCGYVSKTTTIYYPKTIKLSATSYTYNGKVKSPTVTVKDSKGNALKKDTDYTVSYASGRKNTGKYSVTVTFKGKYSGKKVLYFNILPSKTSKITPTCATTSIKASWKKVTGASGYKVELLNSKGKVVKTVTTTKTAYTFEKLSKVTTYKIRVTAYKTIDSKKVYSTSYTTITTSTAPAKVTLSKVSAGSKSATPTWKKVSGVSGYEVMYSTSSKFSSSKTATVSKGSSTKTTIKKLTKGKKYYFKVRAYKTVDGKKIYSAWSAVKSVKVK